MKTQSEVRQSFWNAHHFVRRHGWTQNDYPTDVRVAFVDYVDHLERSGEITEALAARVTL